jgi:hypothetical protein
MAAALAWPLSALAAAPADGKVTLLDPVFVEASPVASGAAGIPWQYFTVPGFEVISRCPNAFNEAYARALQNATAARLAFLPADFWGELPTPIKIVIYNRPPDPREGVVQLNPIDLTWSSEDSAILRSDSVRLSHPLTLGDGDTFINCGNYWDIQPGLADFSVDVDSAILLETRAPRFPAWFIAGVEGQRGLYSHRALRSSLQGDSLVLPNAVWTTASETMAIQDEARKRRKDGGQPRARTLLPLGELFGADVGPDHRDLWGAEASLFVRWGLFRSGNRQGFLDFVRRAAREPVSEALLRDCLGRGYPDVERQLGGYLPDAASDAITLPIEAPSAEPLYIRDATLTEVARIVGDWGRLEGKAAGTLQFEYQRECLDQADRLFERIVARKEKDPLFLAAFGLYALQVSDNARAREALEAAAAAGVVRPLAYVELARLRLQNALPAFPAGIGDLKEPEFAELVGLLTTARMQMPSLLSGYTVLARVLEHAPSTPTLEQLLPLGEGARLFPQETALACRAATLYRKSGYESEAVSILDRARGFARSDRDRAQLAAVSSGKP